LITAEETVGPAGERSCPSTTGAHFRRDPAAIGLARHHRPQRVENELARRAYFDELTAWRKARSSASMSSKFPTKGKDGRFALAFIDLDNFKHIITTTVTPSATRCSSRSRRGCGTHSRIRHARADQRRRVRVVGRPIESNDQLQAMVDQLLGA